MPIRIPATGLAALALAACATGAAAQTPLLVAGEAASLDGQPATVLLDPAAPQPARAVLERPAAGPAPVLTAQVRADTASRRVTWQGLRWLHRVRDGQVMEVDLRSTATTRERPISSVADGCEVLRTHPLAPDGRDAWVAVLTAGPDGRCASADDRVVYTRRGAALGTAPVAPDAALAWAADLRDAQGRLLWLLMHDRREGGSLVLRNAATLGPGPAVTGGAPAGRPRLLGDGVDAGTQQAHALLPSRRLVHLRWTETGATLTDVPYAPAANDPPTVVDAGGAWMIDADRLLRLVGPAAPVPAATLPAALQTQLAQTPTAVVMLRATGSGAALLAVPKAGGALRTLLPPDADAIRRLVGTAQERVVLYSRPTLVLGPTQPASFLSVRTDGRGLRHTPADTQPVGVVAAARFDPAGAPTIASLLYCRVQALDTDCRRGTLVEENVVTGATTALGLLSVPLGSGVALSGQGWSNGSVLLQASYPSSRVIDLHLARSGLAGSLLPVTTLGR